MKRKHELHTKRVYEPPTPDDGTRILVDRVWPRGLTKQRAAVDLWLKEIAPSTALRKWFAHDPERWDEFRKRYAQELRKNPDAVARLTELLKDGKATLLYGAHDTDHNNAVALAAYLSTH